MHDTLTGVANRSAFNEQFQSTLDRVRAEGGTFGLLFIDLDYFKQINDRLGHQAGDELLKIAAARIQGNLRKKDKLFRAGGDEFIALLPSITQAGEAGIIAERIIASVQQPVVLGSDTVEVGASIGIAVFPQDGSTASDLVRHADAAMYRAKQSGRGRYAFHTADSAAESAEPNYR
jgi:diguanylate cyclase (GGDEF)-like protein